MKNNYLFLPVFILIIGIILLLAKSASAQTMKTKIVIESIDGTPTESSDSLVKLSIVKVIEDYNDSMQQVRIDTFVFKSRLEEQIYEALNIKHVFLDSSQQFFALSDGEIQVEMITGEVNHEFIVVGNHSDEIIIERKGEMIFLSKSDHVDGINSIMEWYECADGKKAIVIETKIVLDDFDNEEIKELKNQGIEPKSKGPDFEFIRYYPNPVHQFLSINFRLNEEADTKIMITNLLGQVLYEESLSNFSGEYEQAIDMQSYAKGSYVLSIQHGKRKVTKKVIVE